MEQLLEQELCLAELQVEHQQPVSWQVIMATLRHWQAIDCGAAINQQRQQLRQRYQTQTMVNHPQEGAVEVTNLDFLLRQRLEALLESEAQEWKWAEQDYGVVLRLEDLPNY